MPNKEYKFEPNKFINEKYFNNDTIFSREITENERWFQGAEDRLEWFFKNEYNTFTKNVSNPYSIIADQTKFWKSVSGKTPRVHSGLPKLATGAMVSLIAGSGFSYKIDENEEAEQRLESILEANDFKDRLFQQGVATESWAGFFFYKVSFDAQLSDKPIIELVSPKDAEIIVERNRIAGYKFKTRISNEEYKEIEIQETYKVDRETQKLRIEYKAYTYNSDNQWVEIPLPEGYQQLADGIELGVDFAPAVLKNNTSYNSRFPDSKYGQSDYTSVQSLFHMLDDLLSQVELEIRNAKAIKFINEKLIPKDENGLSKKFDQNQDEIELLSAEMELADFDLSKFVSVLQGDIRVEKYERTIQDLYAKILSAIGLSPVTVGLPGYDSVNASAQSQREKEKLSLRTRAAKLKLWEKCLEDLFVKVLKFDDYLNGREIGEYQIDVEFDEYASPTQEELIQTLGKAVESGILSIQEAQEEYFGSSKSNGELDRMYVRTKIEKGIPLTVQENLLANQPDPEESEE
jgi:hypothetical protein